LLSIDFQRLQTVVANLGFRHEKLADIARNVRRCVSMTNCVQPSTAAVNVTLLAFAAAAQLLLGAGRAAIDRYRLPVRLAHSGKPAARCRQFGQTDGQTDGHRTITQSLPHTLAISANLAS